MAEQQHQISNNSQLMSAKKLGLLLDLSRRQITRLNVCGKIPGCLRIAGAVRWSEQTITDWISMGCPDRKTFETRMEEQMAKHRTEGQV